ncbi:MAG: NTP transferase domain-containing protein, partial [Gaiellales bacterium]
MRVERVTVALPNTPPTLRRQAPTHSVLSGLASERYDASRPSHSRSACPLRAARPVGATPARAPVVGRAERPGRGRGCAGERQEETRAAQCAGRETLTGPNRLGAIVLAGGGSTRMGEPKALLDWEGSPLVVHVARVVAAAAAPVVVVGAPGQELPALPDGVEV